MRFRYRNAPALLPADWRWVVEPAGNGLHRIRIEAPSGRSMTLEEAITRAELETTSSRPGLRTSLPASE